MKGTQPQSLITIYFLAAFCLFVVPAALVSQGVQERPSSESQEPFSKDFKASPTFFATKNNDQRCNALDVWFASMRYEVLQPAYVGDRPRSGDVDLDRFNAGQLFELGTPAFRAVFGKGLPELKPSELSEIGRTLDKCSQKRSVPSNVVYLFNMPQSLERWMAKFNSLEQTLADTRLEVRRHYWRLKNIAQYDAELKRTGIPAAEIIKETPLYRLNGNLLAESDWCDTKHQQAMLMLAFKVDENFQIDNTETYWRRFEDEMLPAITAQCPAADYIYIGNYIEGSLLVYDKDLLTKPGDKAIGAAGGDAFSAAIYTRRPSDGPKHRWFYGANGMKAIWNFVHIKHSYTQTREISLALNDERLTSIARMRDTLKLRAEFVPQRAAAPVHNAGEKIFENELYAVYKAVQLGYTPKGLEVHDGFCGTGHWFGSQANVSVVFKADADYIVTLDDRYKLRFENEILPRIRAVCQSLGRVRLANYIYDVRLNRGEKNKVEAFGIQQLFAGIVEAPLSTVEVNMKEGHFIYEFHQEWGDGIDASSLARLKKSYAETKDLSWEARRQLQQQRQAEAQQAEESHRAEVRLRERITRDRDSHRRKATAVLAVTKKGAPAKYNFSGYEQKEDLQNIYEGNFEPYIGGFNSQAEFLAKYSGSTIDALSKLGRDNDGAIARELSTISTAMDVSKRRALISMAFYAYHNVYREQCMLDRELPWVMSDGGVFSETTTTSRGRIVVSSSTKSNNGVSAPVREPFADAYHNAYSFVASYYNTSPEIPRAFAADFNRLLKVENCSSPSLRQFEINLYLASEWLLPLQVLRDPEKAITIPTAEQPKPMGPVVSPKPAVGRRKAKTRP